MALIQYDDDTLNYNSFASTDDLNNMDVLYDTSEFMATDDATKEKFLVYASKNLCQRYRFKGYKKKSSQSLCFPRINIEDYPFIEDIPDRIKCATCILAFEQWTLLKDGVTPTVPSGDENIKREKIGKTTETEYFSAKDTPLAKNSDLDPNVYTPVYDCIRNLIDTSFFLHRA